jgi:hypothetical protein
VSGGLGFGRGCIIEYAGWFGKGSDRSDGGAVEVLRVLRSGFWQAGRCLTR